MPKPANHPLTVLPGEVVTVPEAARRSGLTSQQIRVLLHQERIRGWRSGASDRGKFWVYYPSVEAFLAPVLRAPVNLGIAVAAE